MLGNRYYYYILNKDEIGALVGGGEEVVDCWLLTTSNLLP